MRTLCAAVYLRMAEALNGAPGAGARATAARDHLQVLCHGFAFRLRVWNDRETRLLRALGRRAEAEALERDRFARAQHAAAVVAAAQRFPALGETARLAKRWAAGQRLSGELCDEALELLQSLQSETYAKNWNFSFRPCGKLKRQTADNTDNNIQSFRRNP